MGVVGLVVVGVLLVGMVVWVVLVGMVRLVDNRGDRVRGNKPGTILGTSIQCTSLLIRKQNICREVSHFIRYCHLHRSQYV